jgi:hypothetical protein
MRFPLVYPKHIPEPATNPTLFLMEESFNGIKMANPLLNSTEQSLIRETLP